MSGISKSTYALRWLRLPYNTNDGSCSAKMLCFLCVGSARARRCWGAWSGQRGAVVVGRFRRPGIVPAVPPRGTTRRQGAPGTPPQGSLERVWAECPVLPLAY